MARKTPRPAAAREAREAKDAAQPRPVPAPASEAAGTPQTSPETAGGLRAALSRGLEAVGNGQLALIDVVLEPVNPHEVG